MSADRCFRDSVSHVAMNFFFGFGVLPIDVIQEPLEPFVVAHRGAFRDLSCMGGQRGSACWLCRLYQRAGAFDLAIALLPELVVEPGLEQGDFVEWAGCTTRPRGIAERAVSCNASLFAQCA